MRKSYIDLLRLYGPTYFKIYLSLISHDKTEILLKVALSTITLPYTLINLCLIIRRVWRYQRGNQNLYIEEEEEETTQLSYT
jgi:hypothetical protein